MKYVYLLLCIGLTLTTFQSSVAAEQIEPAMGTDLYLQACGADPQKYFSEGKMVGSIVREVPNKVMTLETSPYGRPFTTKASSKISLENGQELTAELVNFRDLTVRDNSGKILYTRQISGATSIYEVIHKGKTVAWGAGWHNYCREYYKNTEFTVLRVLLPQLTDAGTQVIDRVFNGAYTTEYLGELTKSPEALMIQSGDIYNGGCCSCFYCLPRFFTLSHSTGFTELKTPRELEALGMDIAKVNPLIYIPWLSQYGLLDELKTYLVENYDTVALHAQPIMQSPIMQSLTNGQWSEARIQQQKAICIEAMRSAESFTQIGKACLPELESWSYFRDLSEFR